jgi:hypothetical protein
MANRADSGWLGSAISLIVRVPARPLRATGPFHKPWPEGEIGHARQPIEVNVAQGAQTAHHAGPLDFELAPQLALKTSLRLADGRQGQKNRSPRSGPPPQSGRVASNSTSSSSL